MVEEALAPDVALQQVTVERIPKEEEVEEALAPDVALQPGYDPAIKNSY